MGIYIKSEEEITQLYELIEEHSLHRVDFHFVYSDGGPYPVNVLRNVAMEYALTDYYILLDVDFRPCNTLYEDSL